MWMRVGTTHRCTLVFKDLHVCILARWGRDMTWRRKIVGVASREVAAIDHSPGLDDRGDGGGSEVR